MHWALLEVKYLLSDYRWKLLNPLPNCKITTWIEFRRKVKKPGYKLLKRLGDFEKPILVTGCQRSGTTLLSRMIRQNNEIVNIRYTKNEELDGAIILAGVEPHDPKGRYCFQTTYLNENYYEYFEHHGEWKLVWVIRNPYSVVHSMLTNWRITSLLDLYRGCGVWACKNEGVDNSLKKREWRLRRLEMACCGYRGKLQQLLEIDKSIEKGRLVVVEYNDIVLKSEDIAKIVCRHVGLNFRNEMLNRIHSKSVKRYLGLDKESRLLVSKICDPVYKECRKLISYSSTSDKL